MKSMDKLVEDMNLGNHLSLEEIPDLNLYMDQVIQLFEKRYANSRRNDDEKVLTKTMINNYAKGKLFFPIKDKRYSKDHLILISMIYQMKGALSINDVKQTLARLNKKMIDDDFDLQDLYNRYLQLDENNVKVFKENIQKHTNEVTNEVEKLNDKEGEYLEQLLMVTALTNMSNFYRRAAEKLVDEMDNNEEKE